MIIGSKVYFFKPPTQQQVDTKKRKAKHIEHYIGPAIITKKLGTKSFEIEYQGRAFQRDAGMLIPVKDYEDKTPEAGESSMEHLDLKPSLHVPGMKPREGEFVFMKDSIEEPDWYCAQVSQVLPDLIVVNWYTTQAAPLENHTQRAQKGRREHLENVCFHRTRRLDGGKGEATTTPPPSAK